jgi:RNA polymerase-binding protein DksA
MPRVSARQKENIVPPPLVRSSAPANINISYRTLWSELNRQRAELLRETIHELLQSCDPTVLSDLLDQASIDQEQELLLLVKQRTREKLREIEVALQRMERRRYGLCLRCQQQIPLARLKVQPSASYCVPCQAFDESRQGMRKRIHGSAV